MAAYTVRVEMHGASEAEYETLHIRMANAGFSRTITDDKGQAWHLPSAEYNTVNGIEDGALFVQGVKAIVNGVQPESWILATKAGSRHWRFGEDWGDCGDV